VRRTRREIERITAKIMSAMGKASMDHKMLQNGAHASSTPSLSAAIRAQGTA
jgi:hypothetical protein